MEIKTTTEIFQAHRKVMNPVDTLPMNVYLESAKKKWVAVDDIVKLYKSKPSVLGLEISELCEKELSEVKDNEN